MSLSSTKLEKETGLDPFVLRMSLKALPIQKMNERSYFSTNTNMDHPNLTISSESTQSLHFLIIQIFAQGRFLIFLESGNIGNEG